MGEAQLCLPQPANPARPFEKILTKKMLATFSKNVDQNYLQHYIKKVRNDSKNVGNISKKCWQYFQKNINEKMP
jgi:hypothetical protein